MDGNSLEQLLVPEFGQTTQTDPSPAPEPQPAPGQGPEPPAPAPAGGHGEPQPTDPAPEPEETVSMARYKELQSAFTKKAMELAQFKKAAPVPEAPPQPQYIPQPAQPNSLAALVQSMVQEQLAPIQQQQQDLYIQAKIMELSGDKDFGDVAQIFVDMLDEKPWLLDKEDGLDLAYKAAKADVLMKSIEARAQAQVQASKQVTASKIANTDTAPNAKAPAPGAGQTEADAIKQSIIELGGRRTIFG